uniref:Uncharacterized protein n=1 Tax=Amphimedon queenslandica TaxID=400682 RepID=A0A1X7UXI3_AMPQE
MMMMMRWALFRNTSYDIILLPVLSSVSDASELISTLCVTRPSLLRWGDNG